MNDTGKSAPSKGDGSDRLVETGVAGLDELLHGGLPPDRQYLIQGDPGAGKTTLALQFALTGAERGETVLYITTSETIREIHEIAASHGWSLDKLRVHYHTSGAALGADAQQTIFHPAEVELPKSIDAMMEIVEQVKPSRLVIDSLSEIRVLARDERTYRRQMMALRERFGKHNCTVLMLDDRTQTHAEHRLQSIVSGVIELEQVAPIYGPARRRIRITKLRGRRFVSGYHDFRICTGGIEVYPRLVAADHRNTFRSELVSSGVAALDAIFGGGIDCGTSTLLLGPAGVGKSTVAVQYVVAAAERGETSDLYIFDERPQTLFERSAAMGMPLDQHVKDGRVRVQQVDPAEMTPGEFARGVRKAVTKGDTRLVVIDSLNGYMQAMPDERFITLHLHELLTFLNQQGVTCLLVVAQHGLLGSAMGSPVDVSYLSDTVLLFRNFEFAGEMRQALSVYKRRGGRHERTIRELRMGPNGIEVGEPLREFRGVMTGVPEFVGADLHGNS